MRPVTYLYAPATTTGIAQSQAGTSGASLTLNTIVRDNTNFGQSGIPADRGASERSVALASTANVSSVLFTIVGLDAAKNIQTLTLTGPNNNTVYTTQGLTVVSSITPNASYIAASGVSAGFGTSGTTNWNIFSNHSPTFQVGGAVVVSGALTYTLQHTFDNLFETGQTYSAAVFNCDDSALVNATTSQDFNYAFPPFASRVQITGTGAGSLRVIYIPEGV